MNVSVALSHHAVLVVAEVGRAQPERAVLLVRVARGDEPRHRLGDAPVIVERRLEEVDVELDAERLQVAILLLAQLAHGEALNGLEIVRVGVGRVLVDVALRQFANVFAVIAALGQRHVLAGELPHARLHAEREVRDLRPGVVVVELSRDAPAGRREQRRDRVAERRLASVADVQRAGRIRRHEFDVHRALLAGVRVPVLIAGRDHRAQSFREHVRRDAKIDEPWAGDLRRADSGPHEVQALDDRLREIARLLAE